MNINEHRPMEDGQAELACITRLACIS